MNKMNFQQFLNESKKDEEVYTHIVTIEDGDEEAEKLAKQIKAGEEAKVLKHLTDWDYGDSNEVVTRKAFGRDSTVFEKGEYVLVYQLNLSNMISLYRKGE